MAYAAVQRRSSRGARRVRFEMRSPARRHYEAFGVEAVAMPER